MTVFVLAMLPAESAIPAGTVCVAEAAPRISSSKLTMIKGQSKALKINGLKKGQKITWKSSNSKIITVNKAGKLQAKAKGSATITGTVSKRKYTCKVTVQAPKLNKTSVTLKAGQTYQLKLIGTNQKITWKSSNPKIVTVNKSGKLFAKSAGNAKVTAQVNGIRFVCKVKIQKKAVPAKPAPTAAPAKPAPTAAPAKPTPTTAPKPGIKLKNHILSKGKKASDGSVKIELNTHDESKKIDMDLSGLGSSSSSMQIIVDEYRSITYIPKNNSFKFYFRFSSHNDLKSDITLTFPMNSTAASLSFYFYMSILPDDESGTLIATMGASAPLAAIKNESSNLSFRFRKLTDPYEILTQKDASEIANDTLDMAIPYWADLLKGSGITLRSLGFSTTR